MRHILILSSIIIATLILAPVNAEDWPNWRGPDWDGTTSESDWDQQALASGPVIMWSNNLGRGYSAPAVADGKLFIAGNLDNRDIIYCLDAATGAEIWRHSYKCISGSYPGPRSSAAVSGRKVYFVSRKADVFCLDAGDGSVKWERDLMREFGAKAPKWDFATSVRLYNGMALINACEHGIALDAATGKKVWASKPGVGNYSTPAVFTYDSRAYAAIYGRESFNIITADKGKVVWSTRWNTSYDVNAADPLIQEDRIFISSGYGKGCAQFQFDGKEAELLWKNRNMRNHFSSCVLVDGYLYGIDGNAGKGRLKCLDWKTGEEMWSENLGFGALCAAGNRLIILNERGTLHIAAATSSGYREFSSARVLKRPKCWIAPVLSNGRIYCRNDKGTLVCIDVRGKQKGRTEDDG